MFKRSVTEFFLGSVSVCANCSTERFLNEIYKNGLKIYSLKKTDDVSIVFSVLKRDYKKIYNIAEKTGTKLYISSSFGISHSMRRFKKRYGLAVGFALFVILFYISSLFIWKTEISGCEKLNEYEVLELLEKSGFKEGMLKRNIITKEVEERFLYHNEYVSWISINIKGTTASVQIREKNEKPENFNADTPGSIYASRDGVISSVHTYMGYSLVKPGDTVTAGDVIVTGNYTDRYGVEYKLHSYAKVMAFTTHSHSVTVPFEKIEHISTGKIKNKYAIKFIRFIIPLYFNKNIRYNKYDVTTSEKTLKLGSDFVFPVSIIKTTYTQVDEIIVTKTKQAALVDAYELLDDYEYNLVGIVINDRSYEEYVDDKSVTLTVKLDCYEDIGVFGKLE